MTHGPINIRTEICPSLVHILSTWNTLQERFLSKGEIEIRVQFGSLKLPYFSSGVYPGCGTGSSVGIATELRAGRSGIESRWERDFPPVQTGPGAHPASCKMGTGSFPGVKCGRGVLLTTHPLLVPRSWNSTAIPVPTLWAKPGL